MASERQIAANRRNAQKSTGPRSVEGKKRASRNAYRHGLAAGVGQSGKFSAEINTLASEIAAAATGSAVAAADAEIFAFARSAAQAEINLARIRTAKAAIMSSLFSAPSLPAAAVVPTVPQRILLQFLVAESRCLNARPRRQPPPHHDAALPRSLTELLIVDRYEHRATAHRNRAILHIIARHVLMTVVRSCNWRNEPKKISSIARSMP